MSDRPEGEVTQQMSERYDCSVAMSVPVIADLAIGQKEGQYLLVDDLTSKASPKVTLLAVALFFGVVGGSCLICLESSGEVGRSLNLTRSK